MAIGVIAAVGSGLAFPLILIFTGELTYAFVDYQRGREDITITDGNFA